MKYLFFLLSFWKIILFGSIGITSKILAQDTNLAKSRNLIPTSKRLKAINNNGKELNSKSVILQAKELENLYIGFSEDRRVHRKKLLVMQVTGLDSSQNEIRFKYTLNSLFYRHDGFGKIYTNQSLVEFHKLSSGTIYRGYKGKIIFESLKSNSLNHWIMKEK